MAKNMAKIYGENRAPGAGRIGGARSQFPETAEGRKVSPMETRSRGIKPNQGKLRQHGNALGRTCNSPEVP